LYKYINNYIANTYWESRLPQHHPRLTIDSSASEVESFIRDKYVNKRWVN